MSDCQCRIIFMSTTLLSLLRPQLRPTIPRGRNTHTQSGTTTQHSSSPTPSVRRCYATRHIKRPLTSRVSVQQVTIIPSSSFITMSGDFGNFSSFTRGGYGGSRPRPDYGNRHYVRGGRGRGGGSTATPLNFPPEADIKKGLDTSKVIETIPQPSHPSALEDLPIENVQYVASYNWVDTEQPTIVVPGMSFLSHLERHHSRNHPCRFASYMDRA